MPDNVVSQRIEPMVGIYALPILQTVTFISLPTTSSCARDTRALFSRRRIISSNRAINRDPVLAVRSFIDRLREEKGRRKETTIRRNAYDYLNYYIPTEDWTVGGGRSPISVTSPRFLHFTRRYATVGAYGTGYG